MTVFKKNDKCVFFAINDGYSFAFANVLMSIKNNSPKTFSECDVICYHDGISERNKKLLKSIHENLIFEDIKLSEKIATMLNNAAVMKWGIYILVKFKGFELVKRYNKVLHLDADIIVNGDLQAFFDLDYDMAWRKVLAWNPCEIMSGAITNKDDYISAPSGGVIYFNSRLNKYDIKDEDILEAFDTIKDFITGGIDERVIGYLAYKNNMNIKELSIEYNNPVYNGTQYDENHEPIIIHFLDYRGVCTKPWKSLAAFLFFDEWAGNYKKWTDMGGNGPVNFSKKDYYTLFGFDRIKKLSEAKSRISKLTKKTESINREHISLKKQNKKPWLLKLYLKIKNKFMENR